MAHTGKPDVEDTHATPDGPRYATREDFVYGEDVTIGEWTISTENLPRYKAEGDTDRHPEA